MKRISYLETCHPRNLLSGIHAFVLRLDSRLRGNDSEVVLLHASRFTRCVCFIVLLFSLHASLFTLHAHAKLETGMDADIVIGQPNFTSVAQNQGSGTGAHTLSSPRNATWDGKRLYIADYNNDRILVYNSIPQTNNARADFVIGQANFQDNGNAVGPNRLDRPHQAIAVNGKLFIADRTNSRWLIFNSIPMSSGESADVVLGQPNLNTRVSNNGGISARSISDIFGISVFNQTVFVADRANNRVLIYQKIPTANFTPADVVVGQANFNSNAIDQGGLVGPKTLEWPYMAITDGVRLIICDRSNHRILIYNKIPSENNASADVVIGQPDFFSDQVNQGGAPGPNTLSVPAGIFTDGQRLFIAEDGNHRVLVYNKIPTVNNAPADIVLGQADFRSNARNRGGDPAANTMSGAYGVFSDGRHLFVTERNNNRVLVFKLFDDEQGLDLGPQFSQGKAVVGKVFWDFDGDGRQDGGIS